MSDVAGTGRPPSCQELRQATAHLSAVRSDMNRVIGLLGKVKKCCQYEIWGLK